MHASEPSFEIDDLRAWLGLDLAATRQALGPSSSVVEGSGYQQTTDLTMVWNKVERVGWVAYLSEGRVVLLHAQPVPARDVHTAIHEALGEPELTLASRAAKQAVQWVWPEQGVALSRQGDRTDFVDVFTPCSADDYRARWYRAPDEFTR